MTDDDKDKTDKKPAEPKPDEGETLRGPTPDNPPPKGRNHIKNWITGLGKDDLRQGRNAKRDNSSDWSKN